MEILMGWQESLIVNTEEKEFSSPKEFRSSM